MQSMRPDEAIDEGTLELSGGTEQTGTVEEVSFVFVEKHCERALYL